MDWRDARRALSLDALFIWRALICDVENPDTAILANVRNEKLRNLAATRPGIDGDNRQPIAPVAYLNLAVNVLATGAGAFGNERR
jgi:hypothetical protein